MRDLGGKHILVTGAGHGIGRALTLAFAARGALPIATDVDPDAAAATARLATVGGSEGSSLCLDVTDPNSIERARRGLADDHHRIDVLVNNAGIVSGGAFVDVAVEQHLRTYDVNLLGLARVTHAFLPDLIARPQAHIVNIASASGYVGLPYGATYASSKWGVIGFSESIRLELRETGNPHVKVTTVCPGFVETGMFQGVRAPLLTPFLTPDRLAQRVLSAVQRDRAFVRTPWTVELGRVMGGVLPTALFDGMARAFGVHGSMRDWRPR